MLALWFHIACQLLNIVIEQYIIESDYAYRGYAAWDMRDYQIQDTLYYYIPFVVTVLIVILHTRIAVQVIVYSLRSNKPEDDLKENSPIDAYILSLQFK